MAFLYVVRSGDTLYRIARRFHVNLQALISSNPQIERTDYIVPGQVIIVPDREPNRYVIQPGDTFYEIARRFELSLQALLSVNPGIDPYQLMIGQVIILPAGGTVNIVDTMTEYGYEEMRQDIAELLARYPFIEAETIGRSVLGKDLIELRIGSGPIHIHMNGAFHANEWITTVLLMKALEDIANAYSSGQPLRGVDLRPIFDQVTLSVVPMVNPDGVTLVQEGITPVHPFYEQLLEWNNGSFDFRRWKANIRGVDLNDQFPANWEIERERRSPEGPGPRDYTGTAPLTEPEAIAIAELTGRRGFDMVLAFHTQGAEIYWNYRDLEPPESEMIAERLARVSGYRAVKLTGSDAGFKDWFIQDYQRPGFTIEAGRGINPLPIESFPGIYDEVLPLILEALKVQSSSI